MATKKAPPGKRKKKKRKIRLSLKSSKMKKTDTYSDQLGWSTDVGRTLEEKAKPKGPDTIKHQCQMCGTIMKVPKPKKLVTLSHAHTVNIKNSSNDQFNISSNSSICLTAAINITATSIFLIEF